MREKLQNKKVCFLGFGTENRALLDYILKKKIKCQTTICDADPETRKKFNKYKSEWALGASYDKNLEKYDIIFRIAGYPLFSNGINRAERRGIEISSPIELFLEYPPTKNIVGVTGTKGKGTTSALIVEILKKAGKRVFWGGNIGTPMFSFYSNIRERDWVILELSSFQLEKLKVSPHIAVITNFSSEHLAPADPRNPNYHKNLEKYWEAKVNIFKWQTSQDFLVANKSLEDNIKRISFLSKVFYFDKSNLTTPLPGKHNKENIAAAHKVAKIVKIPEEKIVQAVGGFVGLEHRLELVAEKKGVKYYDDSFATTPESAIIALKSFSSSIILLAGGAEKNSDFSEIAKIITKKVKLLILFEGNATPRLKREVVKSGFSVKKIMVVSSMSQAFSYINTDIEPGDVVLLSPACASFGTFNNYKERGNLFKKEAGK